MATLSSNRFYDLIERLLYARRNTPHAVFDIVRRTYPAVNVLAQVKLPTSAEADGAWLSRVELRGGDSVVALLNRSRLVEQAGMMQAIFVDDRCGIIQTASVGGIPDLDPDASVKLVLRVAFKCQATGIILASNDPRGNLTRSSRCRRFTADLYRKGEAIDVFLLDHFVLTSGNWTREFTPGGRNTF